MLCAWCPNELNLELPNFIVDPDHGYLCLDCAQGREEKEDEENQANPNPES